MRAGAVLVCVLAALSHDAVRAQTPAPAREIAMDNSTFLPAVAEIVTGTSVTWRHAAGATQPHSVTSQPGSPETFDSSPGCSSGNVAACIVPPITYSRKFERAGTFAYYCKVHGRAEPAPDRTKGDREQPCAMCGLLIVRTAPTPTPDATARPTAEPLPISPGPRATPRGGVVQLTAPPSPLESAVPSPSPEDLEEPFAALPISTPEPRASSDSSGALGAIATLAVIGGIGSGGYLAWRRRVAPRL